MKKLLGLFFSFPLLVNAAFRPNVIYILADDLGLGDLSCYGQKKYQTPNIDRLAKEGILFTAHYSGNTVCSPSRANLMTGQHPGHVSVRGNVSEAGDGLLKDAMTVLPEVFKSAGYTTGAYGKWGLGHTHTGGNSSPLAHGFDEFCGWKSQSIAHTYYPSSVIENNEEIPLKKGTYVHDYIMDRAMQFIERNAKAEQPFFCYIPTAVPHAAMHAPKHLHEKWRKKLPEFDKVIGKYGISKSPASAAETVPDVINPIAGFAAMIENLDNQVGDILAKLKKLGIDDNTLVIFTSDNGAHLEGGHNPAFWNSTANLRGHKRDMHEGGIRTPMLARWPGTITADSTTGHLSAFWDVLPTICELLDQPVPKQNDGISFLPTLTGRKEAQKSHSYLYWEFCVGSQQQIHSQAVRKGNWKAYQSGARRGKKELPPMELYHLKDDPYETRNLAAKNPKIVAEMKAIINEAHVPLPGQRHQ